MRDVEHLVATHQAATALRKAGKPIWAHTIRLGHCFHDDDLSFEEKRAEIVRVIKASKWYKNADSDGSWDGIVDTVENLETDDEDSFDYWWDEIYDAADYDRVWIETR